MKSVAFHNLGCKVNSYELDIMQQILLERGYEIVPFDQIADIYVVNTCTVTNIADRKSRQMLHRAKQKNPNALVVAVGCYVQTDPEGIEKDPCIDLAIGNNRKKDIADLIEEYLRKQECNVHGMGVARNTGTAQTASSTPMSGTKTLGGRTVVDIAHSYEYEEATLKKTAEHVRAYIKIQDGCNQFCSYCAIPLARGRVRSRLPQNIVKEIRGMVAGGYREIVLTGIHISSYGIDLKPFTTQEVWEAVNDDTQLTDETEREAIAAEEGFVAEKTIAIEEAFVAEKTIAAEEAFATEKAFAAEEGGSERSARPGEADTDAPKAIRDYRGESKLLDLISIIHEIPGLQRIRISSLEPRIVTKEAAEKLAALPKVCPHFHLSLQSGCDETLKRMNRHYTTAEYAQSVEALRNAYAPRRPAITTDVIVGFPGETEEEFEKSRAFLEQVQFYEMHIFKYSKRAGTRAAVMPGQIPEQVKAARSDVLLELERRQSIEFRRRYIGQRAEVLMEEYKEIGGRCYLLGHTTDYVRVAIPADAPNAADQTHSAQTPAPNTILTVEITEYLTEEILLGYKTDLF